MRDGGDVSAVCVFVPQLGSCPRLGSEGHVGLGGRLGADGETRIRGYSGVCRLAASTPGFGGGPESRPWGEQRTGEHIGASLLPESLAFLPLPFICLNPL